MVVFFAVLCLPTQVGVFRIGYCRCMVVFVFFATFFGLIPIFWLGKSLTTATKLAPGNTKRTSGRYGRPAGERK